MRTKSRIANIMNNKIIAYAFALFVIILFIVIGLKVTEYKLQNVFDIENPKLRQVILYYLFE